MPSTYSNLKIQLMATGENNTTWGDVTNLNLGTALEEAIVGSADVPFSSADVTLTLTDTNASQTARNMRLNLTGTATAGYNLIVPAIEKPYIINNATDGTITVKNATGTGIAVPAGKTMWVYNNGTNVVDAVTRLSSLTLGTDLAVADGGTGASTFTSNGVLIGNGTSAITATAAGTTGQVLVGNTGGAPSWATLSGIGVTSFSAGTTGFTPNTATTGAITLAGTLNVANGGTGATSLTSGYLVKGNGTSAVSASVVYDDGTNVGIGTSSPGNKLSVVGGQINTVADDAYALALNATTGNVRTYPYLSSYSGSALVAFSAGYAGNGPLSIAASTLQLWTGGSERMRVTSAGDVGIGTSSPGAKLHVVGASYFASDMFVYQNGGIFFNGNGSYGGAGIFSRNTGSDLILAANGGEGARLTATGFGIGTSSPGYKLTVSGGGDVAQFTNGTRSAYIALDSSGFSMFTGAGQTGNGIYANATSNYTALYTASSERARIDSSGNLLVGTTSAVGTLTVDAPASTTAAYIKNQTTATWTTRIVNGGATGDNYLILFETDAASQRGSVTYNRTAGLIQYNTTSDYRAKTIHGPVGDVGSTVDALKVYDGTMHGATQSRPMLIAHEAQEVAPYAVFGEKDAVNPDGSPAYQSIDVSALVPLLIAEIQSLRARVAQLEGN